MQIEIVKQVVFKDMHGTVLKVYNVGERLPYTLKSNKGYWVTSMGGIYFDEAKEV